MSSYLRILPIFPHSVNICYYTTPFIHIHRSLRVRRELQIFAILFFDIAAFYLVFAITVTLTEPPGGCLVGAAIAYFCLIAAFMWMAVWAANMYDYSRQNYIQLKWFVRKAALFGFGKCKGKQSHVLK